MIKSLFRFGLLLNLVGFVVASNPAYADNTLSINGHLDVAKSISAYNNAMLINTNHGQSGMLKQFNESGDLMTIITTLNGSSNNPIIKLYSQGVPRAKLYSHTPGGYGIFELFGNDGKGTITLTTIGGSPDNGIIEVKAKDSNSKVQLYVDEDGNSIVKADKFKTEDFTRSIEHPTNSAKEIWYSALDGPEQAIYIRGTAKLKNGSSQVKLPDVFRLAMDADQAMTVQVTPWSAASRGLAVTQRNARQFTVVELAQGKGEYRFDWEVKATRKGGAGYKVVRDKIEVRPADSSQVAGQLN